MKKILQLIWRGFAQILCIALVCGFYRVRTYGRKNVPRKGSLLLLCNHQSFLDPMFAQTYTIRPFCFVARDSLFTIPILGPIIRSVLAIPIKRGTADLSAMKKVIDKLKHGWAVCLFPEATRTSDGKIAEIKPGLGLLSRRGGATIVPVVIDGAFECWPRHKKFPGFGKVAVSYGQPISAEEVKALGDRRFAEVLTEKLRDMQKELRQKTGREPIVYPAKSEQAPSQEIADESISS